MASTTIRIEQEGLSNAIAAIVALDSIDIAELAADLYLLAQADVDERFRTAPNVRTGGVVYGGAMWPALSEPYLKQNPRREGGQQLRDEGELLNSFQVGNGENLAESSPNTVMFGSALPKARGLQEKRSMLFIHDEFADIVVNAIALKIAESA
jgi:hypothetical protein